MTTKRALIVCMGLLCLCGLAVAQQHEELAEGTGQAYGPQPILQGVPAIDGIFMGTSQNANDPAATLNDVFSVDPGTDTATSILSGVQVWGATADVANSRVLFTRSSGLAPPPGLLGGGDELFAIPFAGGTPTSLGRITQNGEGMRIDGLAISGGVLYGANAGAGAENGLHSIDMGTLVATPVGLYGDSISGIDADPTTGIIYGVNDSTGQLVTISTTGSVNSVTAYPGGFSDIDGIAVGGGKAYLVADEGGPIPVWDIAGGAYGPELTNPFTSADVFSGAAFAGEGGGGGDGGPPTPATSTWGVITLVALMMGISAFYLRRRATA